MSEEKGMETGQSPHDRNLIRKDEEAGEPEVVDPDQAESPPETLDKPVVTRFTASETGDEREPDIDS